MSRSMFYNLIKKWKVNKMGEFIKKFGDNRKKYYKNNGIIGINSEKDETDNNARLLLLEYNDNPQLSLEEKVDKTNAHYNPGGRNVGIGNGVNNKHRIEIESKFNGNYYAYFRNPSIGKGESIQEEKKMVHCLKYIGEIGKANIVDYEIPLNDRGTSLGKGKIDLAFFYDKDFYIIETKKIGSDESLLRCVLEVETYFETLNDNFYERYCKKVKKGILVDETSIAYIHFYDGYHHNVKKLMEKYEIDFFLLMYSKEKNEFNIERIWKCPTLQEN